MSDQPTITVTRSELVQLLDDHLPRMAFRQYGQTYNDDPDFDVVEYYERVVNAIFELAAEPVPLDAHLLGMAMDMVAEEDAILGVLNRGTGGERVAAKYNALTSSTERSTNATTESTNG